jgi:hypothetical protein
MSCDIFPHTTAADHYIHWPSLQSSTQISPFNVVNSIFHPKNICTNTVKRSMGP